MKKEIYLDYAATTPTDPDVINEVSNTLKNFYGNPSSMHKVGREANLLLQNSRKRVAKVLDAKESEIFFTGSGTESDNLAILGVARANKRYGNKILISATEHKAVVDSAKQLELEGFIVEEISVNEYGQVDLKELKEKIDDKTILVSVIYGNNEIGTINPIQEISKIIKNKEGRRPYFHTDACQAVGFAEIRPQQLGVDLLSFNGSKIYGPKGVGCLYKKEGIPIEPIIHGGGQESNVRSGTENLAFISGLVLALERAVKSQKSQVKRLIKLRDWFIEEVQKMEDVKINGHLKERLPNNVHLSFNRTEGESLLLMLDSYGIQVSTGSACSSNDLHPSHVLVNIGLPLELVHGSLRFSLGRYTTKDELEYVLKVLPEVVEKIRKICPSSVPVTPA
jgi:cysteine desulfurase